MKPPPIEPCDTGVRLRVRVQPKSSRNAATLESDGRLRVTLTAPPVDGAANTALCAFLAKTFAIPKSAVRVIKGEKSRDKVVQLNGIDLAQAKKVCATFP